MGRGVSNRWERSIVSGALAQPYITTERDDYDLNPPTPFQY